MLTSNVILPNGDIVICCNDFGMRHILGNLNKNTYDEIINGEEVQKVYEAIIGNAKDDVLCKHCHELHKFEDYKNI